MLTIEELNKIYAEKLLKTNSHDAAILKVAWVSYQKGGEDSKRELPKGNNFERDTLT